MNAGDAPGALQAVTLLRETNDMIAELPADDSVAATRQITEALRAINGADKLTLEERYDGICLLDSATVEHTRMLLDEYLHTTRHMKQRESDVWTGAHLCWRELALAYTLCVQHYVRDAAAAAGFQKLALVAVARALRATRRQLQWLRIRYAPPTPVIWVALAELYSQVEAEHADEALIVYPGVTTTFKQEMLKALVLAVLPSENLKPVEQDLATYLVGRFASGFVLSRTAVAGCTYAFDLGEPRLPQPLEGQIAARPTLRYFGPGTAHAAVEDVLRKLDATGEVPPELGLAQPFDAALVRPVLGQIALNWTGKTQERRSEREPVNTRITVVPGLPAIYDVLDQAQMDPFNFADRPDGESWLAHDVSPDGFGVIMPPVIGDWISVGSVAAIEGEAAGSWSVGVVRRMRRLDDGQQHIGVEVLSREPMAVRVMREMSAGQAERTTQRFPVDRAILLTGDARHQAEIELLVNDVAPYREGRLHALIGEDVLLVSLARVAETTDFCTRVALTVLGTDS